MSFNASTIPAFRAALLAALEARSGLTGIPITDGPAPPSKVGRPELIELLGVEGEQEIETMGGNAQFRKEDMELTLLITVVHKTRDKQTAVSERAFLLFDELNQLLRSDPILAATYTGPGVIDRAYVTTVKHTTFMDPVSTTREAGLTVGVRWQAHI